MEITGDNIGNFKYHTKRPCKQMVDHPEFKDDLEDVMKCYIQYYEAYCKWQKCKKKFNYKLLNLKREEYSYKKLYMEMKYPFEIQLEKFDAGEDNESIERRR